MLACLLRGGVDREPHIHALVIAAQRDLLLGKRTTDIRRQIRTTQRDRPAIAASGEEGESGGCLSRCDGKRGWVRGHRKTTCRWHWRGGDGERYRRRGAGGKVARRRIGSGDGIRSGREGGCAQCGHAAAVQSAR